MKFILFLSILLSHYSLSFSSDALSFDSLQIYRNKIANYHGYINNMIRVSSTANKYYPFVINNKPMSSGLVFTNEINESDNISPKACKLFKKSSSIYVVSFTTMVTGIAITLIPLLSPQPNAIKSRNIVLTGIGIDIAGTIGVFISTRIKGKAMIEYDKSLKDKYNINQ